MEFYRRETAGIPIGRAPEVNLRNNHLQYVFTWYVILTFKGIPALLPGVILTPSQVWPFLCNSYNAVDGGAQAAQRGGQTSPAEQELVVIALPFLFPSVSMPYTCNNTPLFACLYNMFISVVAGCPAEAPLEGVFVLAQIQKCFCQDVAAYMLSHHQYISF